jgi:chitinase
MRRRPVLAVVFALVIVLAAAAGPAQARRDRDRVVAAYFAGWDIYGRGYFPKQIPADDVSHLIYAFAYPVGPNDRFGFEEGTCAPADPWADFQQVHWSGDTSVDGVADDPANPDQHLFGNFNQLRKLKARHPDLKILVALGGWTLSTYFSDVAATPQSRAKFVTACIDTFIRGNIPYPADAVRWPWQAGGPGSAAGLFDGIDLDWEYPGKDPGNGAHFRPEDRHNATLLIEEFRRQLDALGAQTKRPYLLTAALPAGHVNSAGSYELAEVARSLDWINLLTYDFHGSWDPWTNFAAPFGLDPADPTPPADRPFWNTRGTVAFYLDHGVPANKLVVGVPFFAKQYARVPAAGNGLYQPFDNTGLDANSLQWDVTPTPTYRDLVDIAKIVSPDRLGGPKPAGLQGFTRFWNGPAGEPWLYNATTRRFISYEDPRSVHERTQLVRELGLRGAMAWEISQDSDDHALLGELTPLLR